LEEKILDGYFSACKVKQTFVHSCNSFATNIVNKVGTNECPSQIHNNFQQAKDNFDEENKTNSRTKNCL